MGRKADSEGQSCCLHCCKLRQNYHHGLMVASCSWSGLKGTGCGLENCLVSGYHYGIHCSLKQSYHHDLVIDVSRWSGQRMESCGLGACLEAWSCQDCYYGSIGSLHYLNRNLHAIENWYADSNEDPFYKQKFSTFKNIILRTLQSMLSLYELPCGYNSYF